MLDIDLNCPPSVGSDVTHQFLISPEAEAVETVVVVNDQEVEKQKRGICGELGSDEELTIQRMRRNEGRFELLIEAVRYVEENETKLGLTRFSELGESTRTGTQWLELGESTRVGKPPPRNNWKCMELGHVAVLSPPASPPPFPVVRSKRGRSLVLPYKYRDSVMEPLSQLTQPDRLVPVPTKRRSR